MNGTGNALDNYIEGNENNNTLDGGAGNDTLVVQSVSGASSADTLIGGAGNDIYYVSALDDVVIEIANQGIDEIIADGSYVLPANVEVLAFDI